MKNDLFRETLRNIVEVKVRKNPEVTIEQEFPDIDSAYEWIEGMKAMTDTELSDYADPTEEHLVLIAHYPAGDPAYNENNQAGYFYTQMYPYEIETGGGYGTGSTRDIEPTDAYGTGEYGWDKEPVYQYEGGKLIAKH